MQCQSCQAVMVFDPARVGQNCEFCGSPALVDYDEIKAPIRPQGVLPFRIDADRVRDDIRRWWRSKWLAPGRLARAALVDTVRSLYIPYWTFDARSALSVGSRGRLPLLRQVEGRDSKGQRVTRQERRTRWEPASGVVDHVLRRRAGAGHAGTAARPAAAGRAVSDAGSRCRTTRRFSPATSSSTTRSCCSTPRSGRRSRCTRALEAAVRAAGAGRYLPQPADSSRLLGPDVQARARAGLAAVLQLRRQSVSGDRQRLHGTHRRQVSRTASGRSCCS